MKTLVLGLGNPILTDDGVGVRVAEQVQTALLPGSSIECAEVGVGGLALMERMIGYSRVILIDALVVDQARPGAVHRWQLDDLRAISPTVHSASPHDTSLIVALDLAQRMGLPLPDELVIYAVEVSNVSDFSDQPTPPVAQAIPRVTAAVLAELEIDA
jgi:hydrogenase maturation protease